MIPPNNRKGTPKRSIKDTRKKDVTLNLDENSSYRLKDEKYITLKQGRAEYTIPAKSDVEYANFTPEMKTFLIDVASDLGTQDLDFDFVITSGTEGKHAEKSLHYTGQAVDVRISPKYRGITEGVDTPWDDPMYKYFYEGHGKDILTKNNMNLLDDLTHGNAPHIHIEEGTTRKESGIKSQSDFDTQQIPSELSNMNTITTESVTPFLTEINNLTAKVEAQEKEVEENPALNLLVQKQRQRQELQKSIIDYSKNAFITPKKDQPVKQSSTAYRPAQLIQTQFRTLEQAVGRPDFQNGGTKKDGEPKKVTKKDLLGGKDKSMIYKDDKNFYYRANDTNKELLSEYEIHEPTGMYIVPQQAFSSSAESPIHPITLTDDLVKGYRKTHHPSRSGDPFDYYFTDKNGIEQRITNEAFVEATNDPEAILREKISSK